MILVKHPVISSVQFFDTPNTKDVPVIEAVQRAYGGQLVVAKTHYQTKDATSLYSLLSFESLTLINFYQTCLLQISHTCHSTHRWLLWNHQWIIEWKPVSLPRQRPFQGSSLYREIIWLQQE